MKLSLTRRAEYGIRILLYLTTVDEGVRVTTGQLAEACEVPAGNVPTIVNILSRAGLLVCSPGRGGGCMLGRDPSEVTILEAIETIEGPFDSGYCLLDVRRCRDKDPHCALHESWTSTKAGILHTLGATTLAEAGAREAQIRSGGTEA